MSRKAPIVRQYKHMGSLMRGSHQMLPELRARYNTLHQHVKPLERRIFKNPLVPLEKKLHVGQAILYSRMYHNAGT